MNVNAYGDEKLTASCGLTPESGFGRRLHSRIPGRCAQPALGPGQPLLRIGSFADLHLTQRVLN